MGVSYSDKYEFPEKRFYWALSTDFKFEAFPDVNEQHREAVDTIRGMFLGEPKQILVKVEEDRPEGEEEKPVSEKAIGEIDPLASSEEEIEEKININFKEVDRLLYTILAIENDCHILP